MFQPFSKSDHVKILVTESFTEKLEKLTVRMPCRDLSDNSHQYYRNNTHINHNIKEEGTTQNLVERLRKRNGSLVTRFSGGRIISMAPSSSAENSKNFLIPEPVLG